MITAELSEYRTVSVVAAPVKARPFRPTREAVGATAALAVSPTLPDRNRSVVGGATPPITPELLYCVAKVAPQDFPSKSGLRY